MDKSLKTDCGKFAEYARYMCKLDAIESVTDDLSSELADSQKTLKDVRTMLESISKFEMSGRPVNNVLRQEDMSSFLEESIPTLLLPDMTINNFEVDLDDIIASMKRYAEDIKKKIDLTQPQPKILYKNIEKIDWKEYADSLTQLSKRVSNIRLNKREDGNNRNVELERKLSQLCQDIESFSQMVQANTTLSQQNNKRIETQNSKALQYDEIMDKLLSEINEVRYLLQNKN